MPVRFQQFRGKRSKPNPEARCVTRPSRWGNPFKVEVYGQEKAVELHRRALLGSQIKALRVLGYDQAMVRRELRGRDLGCYCRLDQPCHADVLLEVANAEY